MPSTASYRSGNPITGFSGHVPGSKWQVGGRRSKLNQLPSNPDSEAEKNTPSLEPESTTLSTSTTDFIPKTTVPQPTYFNPSFVFLNSMPQQQPSYPIQMVGTSSGTGGMPMLMSPADYTQMYNVYVQQAQSQNSNVSSYIPQYAFNKAGYDNEQQSFMQAEQNEANRDPIDAGPVQNSGEQQQHNEVVTKSRSKSVPRKIKTDTKDVFGGMKGGWWSEGQALKNLRRHQVGASNSNLNGCFDDDHDNGSNMTSVSFAKSGRSRTSGTTKGFLNDNDFDVPASGYSGHVPGMKLYGVGKPFTVAAKDCRRRMHNGGEKQNSMETKAHNENRGRIETTNEHTVNTTDSSFPGAFNSNVNKSFMNESVLHQEKSTKDFMPM